MNAFSKFIDSVLNKMMLLTKSVTKTIGWTGWNCLFGVAPILSIFFIRTFLISNNDQPCLTDNCIMEKVISDGIVMFFCTALMGEVAIEYMLSKLDKYLSFFIVICSLLFLACVSIIFGQLFFHPETNYKIQTLIQWQNYLVIIAGIFCLIFKTILFYNEKN